MSEANKHDKDKVMMQLIPPSLYRELGKVLTHGAKKYGVNNWKKGLDYTRLAGAALRHMVAWMEGEDTDQESDCPHIAHAVAALCFLLEYSTGQDTEMQKFDNRNTYYGNNQKKGSSNGEKTNIDNSKKVCGM